MAARSKRAVLVRQPGRQLRLAATEAPSTPPPARESRAASRALASSSTDTRRARLAPRASRADAPRGRRGGLGPWTRGRRLRGRVPALRPRPGRHFTSGQQLRAATASPPGRQPRLGGARPPPTPAEVAREPLEPWPWRAPCSRLPGGPLVPRRLPVDASARPPTTGWCRRWDLDRSRLFTLRVAGARCRRRTDGSVYGTNRRRRRRRYRRRPPARAPQAGFMEASATRGRRGPGARTAPALDGLGCHAARWPTPPSPGRGPRRDAPIRRLVTGDANVARHRWADGPADTHGCFRPPWLSKAARCSSCSSVPGLGGAPVARRRARDAALADRDGRLRAARAPRPRPADWVFHRDLRQDRARPSWRPAPLRPSFFLARFHVLHGDRSSTLHLRRNARLDDARRRCRGRRASCGAAISRASATRPRRRQRALGPWPCSSWESAAATRGRPAPAAPGRRPRSGARAGRPPSDFKADARRRALDRDRDRGDDSEAKLTPATVPEEGLGRLGRLDRLSPTGRRRRRLDRPRRFAWMRFPDTVARGGSPRRDAARRWR